MPCTSCSSDFNIFNWKIKCGECDDKYCTKCLKKREGILYCEKCTILLKRPPDRVKLMELKPKDLQAYLNKNNISTYGLVEKHELVDLLCNKHIPERPKRGFVEKVTANIAGPAQINELIDSFIPSDQRSTRSKGPTSNRSSKKSPPPRPPPPPFSQQPRTSPTSPSSSTPQHSRGTNATNATNFVPPQPSAPPQEAPEPVDVATTGVSEPQASTSSINIEEPVLSKPDETPEGSPLPPRYPKLTDFQSIDELSSLTSKQLKQLLTLNRVDFKGCVEKPELLERAVRLWIDNHELRKELPENIQDLCKLCMDGPLDCVLLECGHIATCIDCGKKLAECPICRQYVIRVVRTFKA